jgi:phosphotransferase system enzyme I (PtsI)
LESKIKTENTRFKAVPVSRGVAMGEAQVVRDPMFQIVRRSIAVSRVKREIARLETALRKAIGELQTTRDKAVRVIGEPGANIFDAQIMIANDQQFLNAVKERIATEKINAEYAYQEMLAQTLDRLDRSRNAYLRQMTHDIKAVSERVLSIMMGVGNGNGNGFDRPTILVGRIFSPGQVMAYAKRNVVGFLTEEGGPTSHMGLIIRSLGIPAVMGELGIGDKVTSGMPLILDGIKGEIIVNPDAETWKHYRRLRQKPSHPLVVLRKVKSLKPVCRDGRRVQLGANLEIPGPLEDELVRLGIGVGLYRTEFLYFTKQSFPDEEEQYQAYQRIAKKFAPLPVTLRTFDLGGDKYAEELGKCREDNPALGWRGIRVALDVPRLYRAQLRAMLRASAAGNVRILLPMVSDASEIIATTKLIEKIKRELQRENIPFDENVKVGAMIEVPSAALSADYLAELVDFFSIGTNDLIQYTMAADRGNHRVARYYQGGHPAVLALIQMTIQAAHENGIPVTVCGEMAGDVTMTPVLVGLGVDELSMNPTLLPGVGEWIRRINPVDAKRFASRVMRLATVAKVTRALEEAYEYLQHHRKGAWLK